VKHLLKLLTKHRNKAMITKNILCRLTMTKASTQCHNQIDSASLTKRKRQHLCCPTKDTCVSCSSPATHKSGIGLNPIPIHLGSKSGRPHGHAIVFDVNSNTKLTSTTPSTTPKTFPILPYLLNRCPLKVQHRNHATKKASSTIFARLTNV